MATDVEKLINEDVEKTLIRNLRSIGFVIDDEDEANEEENEHLMDENSPDTVKFAGESKKKPSDDNDCAIIGMIAVCIAVFILFFCWLLYIIGHSGVSV